MRKLRSWLIAKLDSPFKRFAALVAAIGLAMLLIGWLQIVATHWQYSSSIGVMIDHLFLDDKDYMLFTYGAYLFSIGLMGSVLYKNSVGHVVKWIRGDAATSKGNVMSIYCSQCGVAVSGESKFCFKCGGAIHKNVLAGSIAVETPVQLAPEHAPPAQPLSVAQVSKAVELGEQMRSIIESKVGMSKWWPFCAILALILRGVILQFHHNAATSPRGDWLLIAVFVTLLYTAIAAIYFARSKKATPLVPWEVEARRAKANWYLFVAVSLSTLMSASNLLTGTGDTGTRIVTVVILALIFGAGWAALRNNRWAVVALFVCEFIGAIFAGGDIMPLGPFVVYFCVQAYRYQYAVNKFDEMNGANVLGPISGLTKLAFAAIQAHLYYAKYLVKSGADINEKTATGFTPLLLAAATNKGPAVVKYLLKAGADKTIQAPDGRLAVDFARERGAKQIVSLLTS